MTTKADTDIALAEYDRWQTANPGVFIPLYAFHGGWEARQAEVEQLRAALAESERISRDRLERMRQLRDALIRVEADSRKLGVAPGQLGDTADRALAGASPAPSGPDHG